MDAEDAFPFFLIGVVLTFILALRALVVARSSRAQLAALTEKFYMFDHRLIRLGEQIALLRGPAPDQTAAAAEPVAPLPPETAAAAKEPPVPTEPAMVAADSPATVQPAEPAAAAAPAPATAISAAYWEQLLVENWLVWLGGATLALGGAFLVKLSIDYGLLTEEVRVALTIAFGVGLSVAAEWVRRRDPPLPGDAPGMASYVPQALAAAGAATVFAAVFAAYALYHLIPSGVAFVLLAVAAGSAVAQSLRHGPLVAALGLVGAYAVPALVSSDNPHALPLFAYVAVVTGGALTLLRHREWWWLAWLALAGALIWVPLWLDNVPDPEAPVVAVYLLVLFVLFVAFRRGIGFVGFLAGVADTPMVRPVTRTALWAIAFGLLLAAHADGFGMSTVSAGLAAMIGYLALAYRDPQLDDLIAAAGALALALLASWNLPLPTPEMDYWVFRLQPDHAADFIAAASIFAAALGFGGFAAIPRVPRPGRWAALSAAAPLAILIIAYWRLQKFELDV
ncbi:MAG TPA: DUF2339 domain-containing protein, partial [Acetobacteraceae bacterium]|nr:DUF2339 domain-containing protein [Acetobacteraceae bacterium]